ncbi:hypothetical protein A6P54_16620 [Bacillus sp. MKU004]|nr:hypothetical protein A6P54_16620 [Bacillus sp. MKU004]
MKKDDLKKLFDHVDENEKTSVEFQTVWRKAHRKSWKQKLIQSAGPNLAILLVLIVLTPIIGYYLVNQNLSFNSAQSLNKNPPKADFTISGKIYNFPNQVVIKGQSNLPGDTIINVEHLEKDNQTLISKGKIKTNPDGSFQFTTNRFDREKDYIFKVIVYSHAQSQSIKNLIGESGQKLKKNSSAFSYSHDGRKYLGLKLFGLINMDDGKQHIVSEFLMPSNEFEAIKQDEL